MSDKNAWYAGKLLNHGSNVGVLFPKGASVAIVCAEMPGPNVRILSTTKDNRKCRFYIIHNGISYHVTSYKQKWGAFRDTLLYAFVDYA